MYTELQKARYFNDLYWQEMDSEKRVLLWNEYWNALCKQYDWNMRRVCYVSDLIFQSYQIKKYGKMYSKETDYKFHLLRGLDRFHFE